MHLYTSLVIDGDNDNDDKNASHVNVDSNDDANSDDAGDNSDDEANRNAGDAMMITAMRTKEDCSNDTDDETIDNKDYDHDDSVGHW